MSTKRPLFATPDWRLRLATCAVAVCVLFSAASGAETPKAEPPVRVVMAGAVGAVVEFKPVAAPVRALVDRGIKQLAGTNQMDAAWRVLLTTNGVYATNELIGIKVAAASREGGGARVETTAALIESLLAAGLLPRQIVVWDRFAADLEHAGFKTLTTRYKVRVVGAAETGYDASAFYDSPFLGEPAPTDLEFGKKGEGVGRRSHVTKLLTREITRIIHVAPMNVRRRSGVSGHLTGLALDALDNTRRFERDQNWFEQAVVEILAMSAFDNRVALCVTDALICQYQGEQETLLHYSAALGQLWFSRDPVALDVLAVRELERLRATAKLPSMEPRMVLYENAALMRHGVTDLKRIRIERAP